MARNLSLALFAGICASALLSPNASSGSVAPGCKVMKREHLEVTASCPVKTSPRDILAWIMSEIGEPKTQPAGWVYIFAAEEMPKDSKEFLEVAGRADDDKTLASVNFNGASGADYGFNCREKNKNKTSSALAKKREIPGFPIHDCKDYLTEFYRNRKKK